MIPAPFDMLPSDRLKKITTPKRMVLFREGDPTKGLFLSLTAMIRMERIGPDGEPVTIHTVQEGQSFAEASVFADRYHCNAVALVEGEVIRIPKSVVLAGFADPEFSTAYNRIMSRQVQAYRQIVEVMSIRSAAERVYAAVVAGLLDASVMNLSQRIALTHEATYRALRTLVSQGRLENPSRGQYRLPK
ncbi:Crp/Fnr family transcriptional regulator [Ruegeria sp. 2205SS24-7]|uniref:Crp/Fnr family transcriptional regulator n=1 Tax=Ruegeria discodermiae TaxID=3064389 RepID=UPI00274034B6|nr:Crp/Fnr family transcriptional regulator [Ruegeria sp. 2205SS24-7]MDP5220161.1 Crp/Fnr family transcriptional regulator [Ruegeria sp. 2205SS24-7]